MLVAGFPAGSFAANCYVVAAAAGEQCVIVDPGEEAEAGVAELVAAHGLDPVAVLLTHGHLDHMYAAAAVCRTYDATCWVHPADRHLLSDPLAGLPPAWASALPMVVESFAEPADVRELTDGATLNLAGLEFVVDHVPGHTGGSATFRTAGATADEPELMFSGDLLFAGSIGRTDLPGGDHATMLRSLTERVLPRADEIIVLPGHGDQTTIGRERATNPFLAELAPSGPTRGL